jgi:hypothetical protein
MIVLKLICYWNKYTRYGSGTILLILASQNEAPVVSKAPTMMTLSAWLGCVGSFDDFTISRS